MSAPRPPFGTYGEAHANPKGPGDARPTAIQIVQDEGLLKSSNRLSNKTVLITGGTAGLGLEVAKALYLTGAMVFITGRSDEAKGEEIAESIAKTTSPVDAGPKLHPVRFLRIDLADLASVQAGAAKFLALSENKINLLICDAGVMSPPTRTTTAQGHEVQFGVNYLAHFLLFKLLCPRLLACSTQEFASRVVSVSSCAHRGGGISTDSDYDYVNKEYDAGASYAQSKTANIYLASELERRFGAQGLHGLAPHPGVIMETSLVRHMTDDTDKFVTQIEDGMPGFKNHTKSAQQGAASIVWAAVAAKLDGTGGLYLEDCDVGQQVEKDAEWFKPGIESWAYDENAEKKLWADSEEMLKPYL